MVWCMDKVEAGKFIGNTITKAVEGGVHQLDLVAILEAHKHNLLQQAYEANKPRIVKSSRVKPLFGDGN